MSAVEPFPRTRALLQEQMQAGLHIGAQLAVAFADGRILELAVGDAQIGIAMTVDSLPVWLSAGKPIGAVALAQLQERGLVHFDDPVATFIPEFAQNGKSAITLRHILTHTGGFRFLPTYGWPPDWDQIIAAICAMPIEAGWEPGRTAGYHPMTSWFILGEVVRRVDGRSYDRYVREEIFLPLAMPDFWIGMPIERYEAYGPRLAPPHQTRRSPPSPAAMWTAPSALTVCRPGSNATGPARQFVHFYQMLLNDGQFAGRQLLSPESVRQLIAPARIGMFDKTFNQVIDWALGFQVNTDQSENVPYGLGPHFSSQSFGHGGSQCAVAFADPQSGIAAAILCNGMPGESAHHARMHPLLAALAADTDHRERPS